MSSKAGVGKRLKAARRSCTHGGALWQQRWQHQGANDRRVGKCTMCGVDVQQLVPCPAQLRTGTCRDVHGPELAPAPGRIVQGSPWAMVQAQPWWARALAWLLGLVRLRGGQ